MFSCFMDNCWVKKIYPLEIKVKNVLNENRHSEYSIVNGVQNIMVLNQPHRALLKHFVIMCRTWFKVTHFNKAVQTLLFIFNKYFPAQVVFIKLRKFKEQWRINKRYFCYKGKLLLLHILTFNFFLVLRRNILIHQQTFEFVNLLTVIKFSSTSIMNVKEKTYLKCIIWIVLVTGALIRTAK